jgi:hypothetical protein
MLKTARPSISGIWSGRVMPAILSLSPVLALISTVHTGISPEDDGPWE